MRRTLLLTALALAALTSVAAAQSFITNYSAFQAWLPVVFIGIVFSITVTGVYYMAGVVLNNKRVKASALGEFSQAIGTGIITVIIIAVLAMFGTGQLSLVSLLSPSYLQTMCAQIQASTLPLVGSGFTFLSSGTPGVLANPPPPTPLDVICKQIDSMADSAPTGGDITPQIDYGLFSSYIIIANLTNQAANNLNSFYVFTGWIGFLKEFTSFTEVCQPFECAIPLVGGVLSTWSVSYKYKPYAGYASIETMIQPTQFEAVLTFYIMILQLFVILIFLLAWPYILAAGIVLRSTFFTRRVGGMLMAMSLSAVLIFPVMYAIEYAAFAGNYITGPIGANNLPSMPLYEVVNGAPTVYGVSSSASGGGVVGGGVQGGQAGAGASIGGYVLGSELQHNPCVDPNAPYVYEHVCGYEGTIDETVTLGQALNGGACKAASSATPMCTGTVGANINFFVFPNIARVLDYYHCYTDNLELSEGVFAGLYLIPFVGLIGSVGTLVAQVPKTPLDWPMNGCTSDRAINAALAITNAYGITFVSGVMFPLINILVALAAMSGLATLFGGDTDLLGLSKLI